MTPALLPMSLNHVPRLVQAGIGLHGQQQEERYRMRGVWCLHFYNYNGELLVKNVAYPLRPGTVTVVPPDVPLAYRYEGRSVHLYAHFRLRTGGAKVDMPLWRDAGRDFARWYGEMEEVVRYWLTEPRRAECGLWNILWQLVPRAEEQTAPLVHPAVTRALAWMETRLAEPFSVARLAREVGLSHNHLTRLFTAATGQTVIAHIRARRVHNAYHLLKNSTLPIKAVAASVGLPDLHAFNKAMRREFGRPPRALREMDHW